jgi:glycosyltransferase involved in cell wall biosynthesis
MWDNNVIYLCLGNWSEERKRLNWNDDDYANAQVIHLSDKADKEKFIKVFIEHHSSAINVLSGFSSTISKLALKYIPKHGKIVVVTERPVPLYTKTGVFYHIVRIIYKKVRYGALHIQLRNTVDAVLPLGELGVKEYKKVGWSKDKLFQFMYCPELHMMEPHQHNEKDPVVKFLYIGRFMYSTKGIDYLQKAVSKIKSDNWSLDMAGGYGQDRALILDWISKQEKVNFVGAWNSNEVISRINEYDVVIVPSKGEGWNMIVHEAIAASVGVIVTTEAVSDELIKVSGAGMVIKPFSTNALLEAINTVLENTTVINEWKTKARDYQSRVDTRIVASYFTDILNWKYYGSGVRPKCPWMKL